MVKLWLFIVKKVGYFNETQQFCSFVIFLTQLWSRTIVLLVSLDFIAPVECNRPIKFLLGSSVTI